MYTLLELESKTFGELRKIGDELNVLPEGDRRRRQTWIEAIAGVNPPLLQLLSVSAASVNQVQEPITETIETSPGVEVEPVSEAPLESKFGRIVYPRPAQKLLEQAVKTSPAASVEVDPVEGLLPECSNCFGDGYVEDEFGRVIFCQCEPKLSRQKTQSAIVPAAKNLPGSRVKTSTAHQLLESFKSSAHSIEDFPGVKTEVTVSESAIAPAAKNHLEAVESEHPKLKGITFSDRFLARYSPPQTQIVSFQPDADGQLSLLDFKVQSEPEPPDPDDFESLDAFREAIARWDREHPTSSFVHCEPSSVHCEPLEVSLDSFCEWAPCPDEWYEPTALLEQSKVSELPPGCKSSITSDFSIPTFGRWGDRFNRSDEPPDTGLFAKLPKPKPPNFPPQASQAKSAKVSLSQSGIPKLSRNYPETIPKLFHRVAAGSSTQPARSPPGGDAMS